MPGVSRDRQYTSSSGETLLRSVRWDPEVYRKVDEAADRMGRSINAITNEVMGSWVDGLPPESTDSHYQDIIERLSGKDQND